MRSCFQIMAQAWKVMLIRALGWLSYPSIPLLADVPDNVASSAPVDLPPPELRYLEQIAKVSHLHSRRGFEFISIRCSCLQRRIPWQAIHELKFFAFSCTIAVLSIAILPHIWGLGQIPYFREACKIVLLPVGSI